MDRGEIWLVSLDPIAGHEQSGKRPVLIVSKASFNKLTRLPVVVPVTSGGNFARTAGFTVSLEEAGTKTTGVIRCDQPRTIDMESATIAAQGYRFRVPYGTLLCVSDKPLHGEIKLPGQANRFYEGAISEHLQIGIRAIDLLRAEGDHMHSRKLRTFNEPPFR